MHRLTLIGLKSRDKTVLRQVSIVLLKGLGLSEDEVKSALKSMPYLLLESEDEDVLLEKATDLREAGADVELSQVRLETNSPQEEVTESIPAHELPEQIEESLVLDDSLKDLSSLLDSFLETSNETLDDASTQIGLTTDIKPLGESALDVWEEHDEAGQEDSLEARYQGAEESPPDHPTLETVISEPQAQWALSFEDDLNAPQQAAANQTSSPPPLNHAPTENESDDFGIEFLPQELPEPASAKQAEVKAPQISLDGPKANSAENNIDSKKPSAMSMMSSLLEMSMEEKSPPKATHKDTEKTTAPLMTASASGEKSGKVTPTGPAPEATRAEASSTTSAPSSLSNTSKAVVSKAEELTDSEREVLFHGASPWLLLIKRVDKKKLKVGGIAAAILILGGYAVLSLTVYAPVKLDDSARLNGLLTEQKQILKEKPAPVTIVPTKAWGGGSHSGNLRSDLKLTMKDGKLTSLELIAKQDPSALLTKQELIKGKKRDAWLDTLEFSLRESEISAMKNIKLSDHSFSLNVPAKAYMQDGERGTRIVINLDISLTPGDSPDILPVIRWEAKSGQYGKLANHNSGIRTSATTFDTLYSDTFFISQPAIFPKENEPENTVQPEKKSFSEESAPTGKVKKKGKDKK